MTRRQMLRLLASSAPLVAAAGSASVSTTPGRKRLGVGAYSYAIHWSAIHENYSKVRFRDALGFLEYCHALGAGGVQVVLDCSDAACLEKLRARADAYRMYVETEVELPREESDVARFEADLRAAKDAGAKVVRTAMLGGRRYETFDSAEAFRRFAANSWRSLTLAEPILKKHRLRLAAENHKDWRAEELIEMLRKISSEFVGICVDTGNSIALLEDPMAVVEAYAPWAFSTHLKDMAVEECEEGFLLSEVPLGEGFLDLTSIVGTLERANPEIQFNLETITRNPLKVPCLTKKYWATMETVTGSDLARTLAMVRAKASKIPLPRVSGLSLEEKLALEDANVRKSFANAHARLNL